MQRAFSNIVTITFAVVVAVGLAGCDSTPSTVDDFPIQGTMDSPSGLTVSPDVSPSFEVSYQGLAEHPTAEFPEAGGTFTVRRDSTAGDPEQGGTSKWTVSLATNQIDEALLSTSLVVRGEDVSSGRTITDTISAVATTKLVVASNFTTSFMAFADFEGDIDSTVVGEEGLRDNNAPYTGDQRTIETSGANTTIENANPTIDPADQAPPNTPSGSNGVRFLNVATTSPDGSVTIQRDMNLPDSDAFSFLVNPASQAFTLTLTFTEMDGGNEQTHQFQLPVNPGTGWLKIAVPFSEISDDFDPVMSRSGGNGGLVSVTASADLAVSYALDQMLFGTIVDGQFYGRAELHDFERTTNAYGPPFGGGTYSYVQDVADGSDGLTARRVDGADFFGYNYGGGFGPPALAFLDVDGNDVLSFYAKAFGSSDELAVFVETPSAGGPGAAVSRTIPADTWQKFEIPLSDFSAPAPSGFLDPGLRNFGVEPACDGDCAIDDIKIEPRP